MLTFQHLANAPIREALIQISVVHGAQPDLEAHRIGLAAGVGPTYPDIQRKMEGKLHVDLSTGTLETKDASSRLRAIVFVDAAKQRFAQFGVDYFTYNWLRPYDTWERLRDEALRMWELYVTELRPTHISRIGVRYINDLALPLPIRDFGDFLTEPPRLPAQLPQGLSAYFERIVIAHETNPIGAAIVRVSESKVEHGRLPFTLDIDAFRDDSVAIGSPEIAETLEQLREFKNRIFFASVTPRLLETYQ